MNDSETLRHNLKIAQSLLETLKKQVTAYHTQTIPDALRFQVSEKRAEIASIESRLAQQEGRRPETWVDHLILAPSMFVGREKELNRCIEALSPDERTWGIIIDGIVGIGKTALALKVAHMARTQSLFDAYLFVAARTKTVTPPQEQQETLTLTALDGFVRDIASLLNNKRILQITDSSDRRSALLEELRGRRVLFVLDNLETLPEHERHMILEFLRKLPYANKAIVTSRFRPAESGVLIHLERLGQQDIHDLMMEVGRRYPHIETAFSQLEKADLQTLYEAACGSPLAIKWAMGPVIQKDLSLAQATHMLAEAARSDDCYASLFANISRFLTESDKLVLATLLACQTPVSPGLLVDITGSTIAEITASVERLQECAMINDQLGGYYALHPLTRTYLFEIVENGTGARHPFFSDIHISHSAYRKTLLYWVEYARTYGGDRKDSHQRDRYLESEWFNVEATITMLHHIAGSGKSLKDKDAARMLNVLANAVRAFLRFNGYWDEWEQLSEWTYEVAKLLGDWSQAGWRAYDKAWIHYNHKETGMAEKWAKRMADAMEQGGGVRDRIIATRLSGLVAEQRGDVDEAERLYAEALVACRTFNERKDETSLLNDLGDLAIRRKYYNVAEEYYRQAYDIHERKGETMDQLLMCSNLANLSLVRNKFDEARSWYELQFTLARKAGRQDLAARAQSGLARVLEKEGRYKEALSLAQESLQTRERLRHRDLDGTRELVARLREKHEH